MLKDKIKELRMEKGYFQQEFADILGVSKSTVAMWEIGKRTPDITSIIKMANLFECSTDYLLELTNVKSIDKEIQTACKVTGLSEKSIFFLVSQKNDQNPITLYRFIDIMNILLEDEYDVYEIITKFLDESISSNINDFMEKLNECVKSKKI